MNICIYFLPLCLRKEMVISYGDRGEVYTDGCRSTKAVKQLLTKMYQMSWRVFLQKEKTGYCI